MPITTKLFRSTTICNKPRTFINFFIFNYYKSTFTSRKKFCILKGKNTKVTMGSERASIYCLWTYMSAIFDQNNIVFITDFSNSLNITRYSPKVNHNDSFCFFIKILN